MSNEKVGIRTSYGTKLVIDLYKHGNLLHFEEKKKTDMHYHIYGIETFYVLNGEFLVHTIDTKTGVRKTT